MRSVEHMREKEMSKEYVYEPEKCPKCGESDYFQVSPEQQEKEDPEGYKKFGFYSFFQCRKCRTRWLDD